MPDRDDFENQLQKLLFEHDLDDFLFDLMDVLDEDVQWDDDRPYVDVDRDRDIAKDEAGW